MNPSNSRQHGSQDPQGLVLTIEAGQVVCPSRGIRDSETCFACRRFGGLNGGGELRCAGRTSLADLAIVSVIRAWGA